MKQRRRKQDKQKNIKNALTNFKAFYQNVRGLKSKVVSIMERFSDYQPILITGSKPTVTKRGRTIDVNGKKLALLSI